RAAWWSATASAATASFSGSGATFRTSLRYEDAARPGGGRYPNRSRQGLTGGIYRNESRPCLGGARWRHRRVRRALLPLPRWDLSPRARDHERSLRPGGEPG